MSHNYDEPGSIFFDEVNNAWSCYFVISNDKRRCLLLSIEKTVVVAAEFVRN
jgi:hypothetical protein